MRSPLRTPVPLQKVRASAVQLLRQDLPVVALLALLTSLTAACNTGDQPVGRVGDTITAGDYQLTVRVMENPAERPDRFTSPKIGNRFVKFELTVANNGSQHLPVFAGHFTMRDTGNLDNTARTDISGDRILKQTSLAPGQRTEAVLYFEMAASENPAQLIFAPAVVGWRTRISVDLRS